MVGVGVLTGVGVEIKSQHFSVILLDVECICESSAYEPTVNPGISNESTPFFNLIMYAFPHINLSKSFIPSTSDISADQHFQPPCFKSTWNT